MTIKTENTICPFCEKKILNHSFLESTNFLALYNIAPVLPGHSLVIPKKHITGLMDLEESFLSNYIIFSQKVVKILSSVFNTKSFNWALQEGIEAGQSIAHMHIHIIPRIKNDLSTPDDWYPKMESNISDIIDSIDRPQLSPQEMMLILEKLDAAAKTLNFK